MEAEVDAGFVGGSTKEYKGRGCCLRWVDCDTDSGVNASTSCLAVVMHIAARATSDFISTEAQKKQVGGCYLYVECLLSIFSFLLTVDGRFFGKNLQVRGLRTIRPLSLGAFTCRLVSHSMRHDTFVKCKNAFFTL